MSTAIDQCPHSCMLSNQTKPISPSITKYAIAKHCYDRGSSRIVTDT